MPFGFRHIDGFARGMGQPERFPYRPERFDIIGVLRGKRRMVEQTAQIRKRRNNEAAVVVGGKTDCGFFICPGREKNFLTVLQRPQGQGAPATGR